VTTTVTSSAAPIITTTQSKKGKVVACTSRRRFLIHLRHPSGEFLVSAKVSVNGKTVKTLRGTRLTSNISLFGLPKGTDRVRIRAVTNTGRVLVGTRTYHTCVAKLKGSIPKL
jgi:hypothetical protein